MCIFYNLPLTRFLQSHIHNKRRIRSSASDKMKNTNMSERICVDCHTTKTPMWRGGPAGPRSLCNACGIKHRKRNRLLLGASNRVMMKKSERISSDDDGRRRPWNMREEEEEAAILLMALSCGSVVYA